MAVRWYLAYPLSSRQVLELLAEIHALGHGLRRQP